MISLIKLTYSMLQRSMRPESWTISDDLEWVLIRQRKENQEEAIEEDELESSFYFVLQSELKKVR